MLALGLLTSRSRIINFEHLCLPNFACIAMLNTYISTGREVSLAAMTKDVAECLIFDLVLFLSKVIHQCSANL